jgi:hypothetical protein
MTLFQRIAETLFPPSKGSQQLATAMAEVQESTEKLARKLEEDPCASDPSRRQCRDDVARAIRASWRTR